MAENTSPAEDVREALARIVEDNFESEDEPHRTADAILAEFDVRRRGTVTDADAKEEAVTLAYNEVTGADGDEWSPDRTLAALNALWNAAREVRS